MSQPVESTRTGLRVRGDCARLAEDCAKPTPSDICMNPVRVIARLDIKGPNLVKGIHLEGLRVLGRPEDFARYYYESGADELIYQDVVASLYERNSLSEIVTRTAREIFVPLTVGGGLRTLDDISAVLAAGADKVSINTAAIANPELIRRASRKFGSSTIVVAIEAVRQADGRYLACTDNGRQHTRIDALEWASRAEELGAGEIIVTSVDREGTGEGFDVDLSWQVAERVAIPVIAHGGAGRPRHVVDVVRTAGVDAVALAGMLHYDAIGMVSRRADAAGDRLQRSEGNTEFLRSGKAVRTIQPASLQTVKDHLMAASIPCRIEIGV